MSAQSSNNGKKSSEIVTAFKDVPLGPPDAILGLNEAFKNDTDPKKINLGVGAYRDNFGEPWVLPSVRKAEQIMTDKKMNKEYLGIAGLPLFVKHSLTFAYGKGNSALPRIAGVQSLSGTGACRIAAAFIHRFKLAAGNTIHQPNPTWGNHVPIFKDSGMEVKSYPYYDKATNGLAYDAMLKYMKSADNKSAFLLHACAHNPTGCDPTEDQWKEICKVFKEKNHLAFFDCAYQGFASGDANKDAWALRHFVENGVNVMLAQSYAKNFGLYGERVGCFSVVCGSPEEKERVESQLKIIIRPMYSNPPMHGACIVAEILNDSQLEEQWRKECKSMADRISDMRDQLVAGMKYAGSTKSWGHIRKQIGMFCYTGISEEQVERMKTEFHIYMTKDGRISMAGVTNKNVGHICHALHQVTK